MSTKVINQTGSGTIVPNSVMTFSYSEDVTSLEPENLTGGAGQVGFTAEAASQTDTSDNLHPSSKLLINNTIRLEDDRYGAIEFIVKSLSVADKTVSVTGNTLEARLNTERTAGPYGGSGSNLWGALIYYCGLVDIVPTIDSALQTTLEDIDVNFIGWQGNLWEHLKMLCAAISISDTDNIGLEVFVNENELVFRQAKSIEIDLDEFTIDRSIDIESIESEQNKNIVIYKTTYGVNQVIKEEDRVDITGATENVTISDSMQVDAGETIVKRFKINASLESVNQPVNVSAISVLPYAGTTGEYVVVGSDDLPILPSQWSGQGGSLTVSLTENPNEVELVIVAPPATELPTAGDPQVVTLAPYKIGVESSGEEEYPALYITGTGVFFEKSTKNFITGASSEFTSDDEGSEIDNPFFNKPFDVSCRGIAAAQAACGPTVTINSSVADGVRFGETIGSMFHHGNNKFRITSASFSDDSAGITAIASAAFSDFDSTWSTGTFADFATIMGTQAINGNQAMKFNEFTVIPLTRSSNVV